MIILFLIKMINHYFIIKRKNLVLKKIIILNETTDVNAGTVGEQRGQAPDSRCRRGVRRPVPAVADHGFPEENREPGPVRKHEVTGSLVLLVDRVRHR